MANLPDRVTKINGERNGEQIRDGAKGTDQRKSAKDSPKGPIQALKGMSPRSHVPEVDRRRNGTGKAAACSPNGRPVDGQAASEPDNREAGQDPKAFGVVQEWKIGDLKTHPKQHLFFPDESLKSDRELEADLQAQGQLQPIDILPDGSLVAPANWVSGWQHNRYTAMPPASPIPKTSPLAQPLSTQAIPSQIICCATVPRDSLGGACLALLAGVNWQIIWALCPAC